MLQVTPEIVIGIVLGLLSLAFDYAPILSQKFDALPFDRKRLVVFLSCAVVVSAVTFGQCYLGWFSTDLVCNVVDIGRLVFNILVAVGGMYGFHRATRPVKV